jgi:hypothetical protein
LRPEDSAILLYVVSPNLRITKTTSDALDDNVAKELVILVYLEKRSSPLELAFNTGQTLNILIGMINGG